MFNESCPFVLRRAGHTRISISGQIDEVELVVYAVKIDRLRTTGSVTGERQLSLPYQRIDQAGFADIASPQKSDLRQPVGGELFGIVSA